jgi:hypothetical protein
MTIIECVESVPLKVWLEELSKISYSTMRNRCAIIATNRTRSVVARRDYNNDSDEEQVQILAVLCGSSRSSRASICGRRGVVRLPESRRSP